jgi:hypothetical protein
VPNVPCKVDVATISVVGDRAVGVALEKPPALRLALARPDAADALRCYADFLKDSCVEA